MAPPFPPLTLAAVRAMFVGELLVLVREGGHEPGALDRAILAGFDQVLGEKIQVVAQADFPLDGNLAQDLSNFGSLTEGARMLVRDSRTLDAAIRAILLDKGIKAYLRASIRAEFKIKRLNQFLMHLEFPDKALDDTKSADTKASEARAGAAAFERAVSLGRQIATTLAISPAKADKTGKARKIGAPLVRDKPSVPAAATSPSSSTLPTKAKTLTVQARLALTPYLARTFTYQWGKKPHLCLVEELISSLETFDDPLQARIRAALTGLFQSDLRFVLTSLLDLADEGGLTFAPAALALVKIFTVRLYLQLNAVESAERLAIALHRTPTLFEALPNGEKRRLDDILARCALRSGRAHEAIRIYRGIAARLPDDPGALFNYIASVYTEDLPEALSYSKLLLSNQYAVSDENLVFIGDLLAHNGQTDHALSAFYRILQRKPDYADAYLGLANIALVQRRPDKWSEWLKRFGKFHKLALADDMPHEIGAPFRFERDAPSLPMDSPKVSVIMTSFNSSRTLAKAANSVLQQSASNLELFVVDDQSTDDSREIILSLAARDPRVRYIFNERNIGTYASKNKAILQSEAQFITFHDSDDWMHPLRIESQLSSMAPNVMCSTSNWIRMDAFGRSIVRRDGPYTHLNPASTFFRKDVFSKMGLFDNVRTGADSEILTRIRHRLGHSAVLQLPAVLGIGFHHEASLTQSGATAFDEHRYSPVRLAYTEAWVKWHLSTLKAGREHLSLNDKSERLFDIPDSIAP